MESKTGKRIVSKGEYIKMKGKRESLRLVGVGLLLSSGALGFVTVCALCIFGFSVITCVLGLCFGLLTLFLGEWGFESIKKARQIDPGIPFTRANTADLPAPDSLVRASEEPVQEQQAVLLRAAAQELERHEEQLVRAADGQN